MNRKFSLLLLVVLALLLIGASLSAAASDRTVVIGFTASQTGKYNVRSTRQINGLNLWLNQVNDAGGITLSDGTVITFTTVSYDDESATDRVQELYTRLATDDNADFPHQPLFQRADGCLRRRRRTV
ncbi:MAG: ABC transporter substrate-binding protein [Anaerolineae bacterium]